MKSDIDFPEVNDVGLAAIPDEKDGNKHWDVFLLNQKTEKITNVLITTKGFGKHDGRDVETSSLRHYFEELGSGAHQKVELIPQDLRGITNQFWVSFYIGRKIFDKKFLFLPDTLLEKNLTMVPGFDRKGILIL